MNFPCGFHSERQIWTKLSNSLCPSLFLCLFLYIKNFAVDIVFKCVQLLEWCDYSNARLFIFNTYYTRQSPIVPFLMMSIMNKTVCHCFYVICNENSDALLHCSVGELAVVVPVPGFLPMVYVLQWCMCAENENGTEANYSLLKNRHRSNPMKSMWQ